MNKSIELQVLERLQILMMGSEKITTHRLIDEHFDETYRRLGAAAFLRLKHVGVINTAGGIITITGQSDNSLPQDAKDFISLWNNEKLFGS